MKIVFTGGGTGGHFYPIIAVAEEIDAAIKARRLIGAQLYYLADHPYDPSALFDNGIEFHRIRAGKWRRYFSPRNFTDWLRTAWGIIQALWRLYVIYPDVVFSKGGYVSFPVLAAARLLRLPVFIHESDSRPGRVNLWSGKFAVRIAVSYPEAATFFPAGKTAAVGNPIRRDLLSPIRHGAYEFLKLDSARPVLFVTGGSQGAATLNDTILDILPALLENHQIIHQTGSANYDEVNKRATVVLANSAHRERYHAFPLLDITALRMMAGVASLIISRAGSFVFEIAVWGIPAIIVPIPESVSHDQRTNAFTYARSGGAVVIEQANLTPSILLEEINRLMGAPVLLEKMRAGAKSFARPGAARLIAEEILNIALMHES